MAVSVAVCEIFSVEEWCDLENMVKVVQDHWASKNGVTLKTWLRSFKIIGIGTI